MSRTFDLNGEVLLEGLTAYAIGRQNGFEPHETDPAHPRQERRKEWIRGILCGVAELEGAEDPEGPARLFDERLEQARGICAAEPASKTLQNQTVDSLSRYATVLVKPSADRRPQLMEIRNLMDDMIGWLPWDANATGLYTERAWVQRCLYHRTAWQPIRFTRVLLGPERGPCESDYVPGVVTTPDAVRKTDLFQRFTAQHPEFVSWPAVCVVYAGRHGEFRQDATPFDLEIMREAGDRFLDESSIRNLGAPHQMRVDVQPMAKNTRRHGHTKRKEGQER